MRVPHFPMPFFVDPFLMMGSYRWTQKTFYRPFPTDHKGHDAKAKAKRERKAAKLKRDMAKNKAVA